jgi:hypothetical protein
VLDSSLTLSDVQTGTLTGATITIGNHQAGDTLSFANTPNITGSYNSATGVLALSGADTLAHYQAALESITYSSAASDPTQGGTAPNRTVSWQVTDNKGATSGAASSTVAVLPASPSNPATIPVAPSFTSGTPIVLSSLTFSPSGTFGTFGSDTSSAGTLGSTTSGSGTSSFVPFSSGTFDTSAFGSGAGGPSYFDPGGGFGSGLDFSTTFTMASNEFPADSEAPLTLVADGSLGIDFDQADTGIDDTGIDDTGPLALEKAVAVAERDSGDADHGLFHLVADNDRPAGPDAVRAMERLVPADAVPVAPVAGKLALSAQLRAAGRHGLLHDRLALLKSLHDVVRG